MKVEVISLGGSLIIPKATDTIDHQFLLKFCTSTNVIEQLQQTRYRFCLLNQCGPFPLRAPQPLGGRAVADLVRQRPCTGRAVRVAT